MTIEKVKEVVEKTASEHGLKVYKCEYLQGDDGMELQIEVDKIPFINLEEITAFSEDLSPRLDEIDEFDEPYTLICNSADPEREISIDDLELYEGSYVEVNIGEESNPLGILEVIDEDNIVIKTFIKGKPKKWQFAKEKIVDIHLRVKI